MTSELRVMKNKSTNMLIIDVKQQKALTVYLSVNVLVRILNSLQKSLSNVYNEL